MIFKNKIKTKNLTTHRKKYMLYHSNQDMHIYAHVTKTKVSHSNI